MLQDVLLMISYLHLSLILTCVTPAYDTANSTETMHTYASNVLILVLRILTTELISNGVINSLQYYLAAILQFSLSL